MQSTIKTNLLTTFKGFIADEKAAEMFVSGQAGTGKTTGLFDLVQFCIDNSINYVVCAYTHKACDILRSKLPDNAVVETLHKYLKKRSTVNKQIEDKHKMPAKVWAHTHKSSALARKRAKAWRDYFTFKSCVICLDFPYAMTVHKSQGSTYDTVFLDTQDLGQCAAKDYKAYLKLLYVAISRASNKVYTN